MGGQDGEDWLDDWVREYGDRLVRYLWTYVGEAEEARDLAQDAFLRLLTERRAHPGRTMHAGWLYTVGRRLAIDRLRRERAAERARSRLGDAGPPLDDDMRLALEQAIDRLRTRDRELVLLFYYQGWSTEEIALHYSCPAVTVRTRLHRVRDRLRSIWGEEKDAQEANTLR